MKRSTVCVVLMCLLVTVCNLQNVASRSVSSDITFANGKCIVEKKEYNVGERWSVLGDCSVYTCQGDGSYSGLTCPLMRVAEDSPCFFSEIDLKKMYPKCCPQLVCPAK